VKMEKFIGLICDDVVQAIASEPFFVGPEVRRASDANPTCPT